MNRETVTIFRVQHRDDSTPWVVQYPDECEYLGPVPDDATDEQIMDVFRDITDEYADYEVEVCRDIQDDVYPYVRRVRGHDRAADEFLVAVYNPGSLAPTRTLHLGRKQSLRLYEQIKKALGL